MPGTVILRHSTIVMKIDSWVIEEDLTSFIENNYDLIKLYRSFGYDASLEKKTKDWLVELRDLLWANTLSKKKGEPFSPSDSSRILKILDELQSRWRYVDEVVVGAIESLREELTREGTEGISEAYHSLVGEAYDGSHAYQEDLQGAEKKCALDSVVRMVIGIKAAARNGFWDNFKDYRRDHINFKEDVLQSARSYLDTTWMHLPWLTRDFTVSLLDAEIAPLCASATAPVRKWWVFFLIGLPMVIGLLFFRNWDATALGLLIIYAVGCWGHAREEKKLVGLQRIRAEVASGIYDGHALACRLQQLERNGLYVHSLVYALLKARCSRFGVNKWTLTPLIPKSPKPIAPLT